MHSGTLLKQTKQWLRTHKIRVSKRLGQHFLIDEEVFDQLIKYAQLSADDRVLEIGTGTGELTKRLAEHVQRVYTIERDEGLYEILAQELGTNAKISLIKGDAVKVNWPPSSKLVANLPFSISSPVLFRFFDSNIPVAVLMFQKEFADRLIAKSGTKQYGRLSVMAALTTKVELLRNIEPKSFYPIPAVSSALVRIHRRAKPAFKVHDVDFFAQLTGLLFNQRRKKIRTPLKAFLGKDKYQKMQDRLRWQDQRVEELTPQQIAWLANIISEEKRP